MKHLLGFFLLFLSCVMSADNVPMERARNMAERFFSSPTSPQSRSASLRMVYDGENPQTRSADTCPAYYVFNNENGKGFVIVSADDRTMPVLGYSMDGSFDPEQIPDAMQGHLDYLKGEINYARANAVEADPEIRAAWEAAPTSHNVVKVLETARWGQGGPFNKFCPSKDGKKTMTGCVITATAIVMRYHSWPDAGVGTIPSYNNDRVGLVPEVKLGYEYNWNDMLLRNNNYTKEQSDAIATLMRDIGVMVRANYGVKGTSAYTYRVPAGLVKYMKYDKGIMFVTKNSFSLDEWHKMMQDNIDKVGPIVYSGTAEGGGGHAFVLDGYADDNYYRVNWGWAGRMNGFFLLSSLGKKAKYNMGQGAVLNMKPDKGGEYTPLIRFIRYNDNNGITGYDASSPIGTTQTVKAGGFHNAGYQEFIGEVALAVADREDHVKQICLKSSVSIKARGESKCLSGSFTITEAVPGDRLRCYFRPEGTEEWKLIKGNGLACWEVPVFHEPKILDNVDFSFDAVTHVMHLGLAGTEITEFGLLLTGPDEKDYSSRIRRSAGTSFGYDIDTEGLPEGKYVLKFTHPTYLGQKLTVKLGEPLR